MAKNTASDEAQQPQMHAQVVGQFIRDLSFENPNVTRLLDGPGDNPNLKIEVNVNAERVRPELFQSAIDFKAHATNKDGTIYIMECVYGGLFKLQNVPEQAMEPFLLINCPTILFPFLRRLVADRLEVEMEQGNLRDADPIRAACPRAISANNRLVEQGNCRLGPMICPWMLDPHRRRERTHTSTDMPATATICLLNTNPN